MRRGSRPAPATAPVASERRRAEQRDLRDAMDHLQEVYRQGWGVRTGAGRLGSAGAGAELQAAKNRVLALRLKHGL